jgi:HEPN domain-containing protein
MRDSSAEAQRWLRQAENDLAFGEVAVREGYFSQACFVAQQTAEKALKSLAYGQGERIVLGHSIVELVGRLARSLPGLEALRERAGLLDQYYVAARYPNGLPGGVPFEAFGERQAQEAIEAARAFVAVARQERERHHREGA